jgi:hypothetical protein
MLKDDVSAEGATIGIASSIAQPFLYASMTKDVETRECNRYMVFVERLRADGATLGWFKLVTNEVVHLAGRDTEALW